MFWVRNQVGTCGKGTQILKAPLGSLGSPTQVSIFHTGDIDSLSVDDSTGVNDLYFGRETCARVAKGDIFEIPNA